MDVGGIETFLAIAQLGGFTRAASRLNRSQPAISRRLGLLEQEIGAPLLERVRGGVILTPVGRAFLPHAEAAMAALRDGREAVRVAAGGGPASVSLALVGTLAEARLVQQLRRFARRPGSARVELRTATSREVSHLVRRGEVMLGLRYATDPDPQLVSRVIGHEVLRVVVASDHPLAGRGKVSPVELGRERWIGFPPSRSPPETAGDILLRQLAAAGLGEVEVMAVDSLTAQKRLVEAGFGVALLPQTSIVDELRVGSLAVLDVKAMRAAIPVTAIHRRNGYLSPAAKQLLALLGETSLRLQRST